MEPGTMVLYVMKWDVRQERAAEYGKWAITALQRMLATGDVTEFRAWRPVSGTSEVVVTYEFADLTAFGRWYQHESVQRTMQEAREFCEHMVAEVWGPSPVVPKPVHPQGEGGNPFAG
jgi:hypothetical protein